MYTILVSILTNNKPLATAFLVQDNFIESHSQIHLSEKELKSETSFLPSHVFILPLMGFFAHF